jgi:hypothetical protein
MAAIVLTEECNLSCQACFRPRRSGGVPQALSAADVERGLDDLVSAGRSLAGFTGGEPGLWSDGDIDLPRLLVAAAQRDLSPMVVTNGYPFRDATATASFLDRYFASASAELHIYLSIDRWHEGTWREGRSMALDALLRWREAQREPPPLKLGISSLWCLDDTHNLAPEAFAPYVEAGIGLGYIPLSPPASSETLGRLAPRLRPSGRDKRALGSYGDVLRGKLGLSWDEWSVLDNAALVGPCQAGEMLTLGLEGSWWLCNDRAGSGLHVAAAGDLSPRAIEECLARNPVVSAFRRDGVVPVLRQSAAGSGPMPPGVAAKALATPHAFGISGRAGCGLCRSLPDGLFS